MEENCLVCLLSTRIYCICTKAHYVSRTESSTTFFPSASIFDLIFFPRFRDSFYFKQSFSMQFFVVYIPLVLITTSFRDKCRISLSLVRDLAVGTLSLSDPSCSCSVSICILGWQESLSFSPRRWPSIPVTHDRLRHRRVILVVIYSRWSVYGSRAVHGSATPNLLFYLLHYRLLFISTSFLLLSPGLQPLLCITAQFSSTRESSWDISSSICVYITVKLFLVLRSLSSSWGQVTSRASTRELRRHKRRVDSIS